MEVLVVSCVLLTLAESAYIADATFPKTSTAIVETTTSSSDAQTKCVEMISMGLDAIPKGNQAAQTLDVSYNYIGTLPDHVFWNNSFVNLRKIYLHQNLIGDIGVDAFRGVRQARQIDLSDNVIETIDPYTFKTNSRLQKLILMNNLIAFDRLQTFIISHSIEHLVLSNNKIEQIYDVTFLGVPNLRSLILNDNELIEIAENSFRTLNKLHYLSLINTGVHRLGQSMFSRIPDIINLEGTPLSNKFEPPLKKVIGESAIQLVSLSKLLVDENYFVNE